MILNIYKYYRELGIQLVYNMENNQEIDKMQVSFGELAVYL